MGKNKSNNRAMPNPGGNPMPRQQQRQQSYQATTSRQNLQQAFPQYPQPQNWQQSSSSMPAPGQAGAPAPNEQFSYSLPQGMVAASHPQQYYSSSHDSTQISPAESEFSQPISASEGPDSYPSHMARYPSPQGYYSQMHGQAFISSQPAFVVYPSQVQGHAQGWNQPQYPIAQQQQHGSQMQYLSHLQQQQQQPQPQPQLLQQHLQQQQGWEGSVPNHSSHFQNYGYHQPYGSSYVSPTSSRNSSGRMEHLRSIGSSGSGSGGRASPRNNHPRQDSVAASLASSENSFNPFVPGQSPRPSDSSSPGNPTTQSPSSGHIAGAQAEAEPAPRSEFVLWCGNVPSDASVDELWSFFSTIPAEDGGPPSQPVSPEEREATQDRHGILSIFIISRSNCAFVNYISDSHLQRGLGYFHGKIIRPSDPRCQRLVVRIRKKGDEQMSGVSGQRGKGMHVAWVKEQERKKKEAAAALKESLRDPSEEKSKLDLPPGDRREIEGESSPEQSKAGSSASAPSSNSNLSVTGGATRPSPTHESSAGSLDSSNSFTSTNSSLFRHPAFRTRFFILKSANVEQLDNAVVSGQWRTQAHNEAVLDQAFRNSEDVILIFSANQSGNFYGYAKMKGPISPPSNVEESPLPSSSSKPALSSAPKTETIAENEDEASEDRRASTLKAEIEQTPSSRIVLSPSDGGIPNTTSPLPLSPGQQASESNTYFAHQPHQPNRAATSAAVAAAAAAAAAAGGASWPPLSQSKAEAEPRRASASPKMLAAFPSRVPSGSLVSVPADGSIKETDPNALSEVTPSRVDTATPKSPGGIPAVSINAPGPDSRSSSSLSAALESLSIPATDEAIPNDESGVTHRDMINVGNSSSPGSGKDHSLGPQDSVSWPDSRAFGELAIRAVIHNLRLEEKESLKEAREANAQSQRLESSLISSKIQNESQPPPSTSQIIKNSTSAVATAGMDQIGKPFPIEWKETRALPFSVVRNLRNPWRDNKQIKVSRDGTELEPTVGKTLLQEWEKAVKS